MRLIGLGLLAIVVGVSGVATTVDLSFLQRVTRSAEDVRIYFGGEKSALLENPDVQAVLNRHGVRLDAIRAGSVEMATTRDTTGIDCIWPSNMVAVELARASGRNVEGVETIFTSPIVFFAWSEVADALLATGAVTDAGGVLQADVAQLGELIESDATWEELGLDLFGRFRILSTDPTKSNSGNIWSALLATIFNGGDTPTPEDMAALLPRIEAYFDRQGLMESSSGDMFEGFLKQGLGARPIIVGYENQLVEFLIENRDMAQMIEDRIRVIYPRPTIFASHPLISLTEACGRLEEALLDPELQDIAWSAHGFRTGVAGIQNDPAALQGARLPETVTSVAPMPEAAVVERIIEVLQD